MLNYVYIYTYVCVYGCVQITKHTAKIRAGTWETCLEGRYTASLWGVSPGRQVLKAPLSETWRWLLFSTGDECVLLARGTEKKAAVYKVGGVDAQDSRAVVGTVCISIVHSNWKGKKAWGIRCTWASALWSRSGHLATKTWIKDKYNSQLLSTYQKSLSHFAFSVPKMG